MVLRSVARIAACPASRDPSDPSPAAASWRAVVTTSSASAVPASTRIQPRAAAASAAANGPAVAAARQRGHMPPGLLGGFTRDRGVDAVPVQRHRPQRRLAELTQ